MIKALIAVLRKGLSLQLLLYFAHWNIKGMSFPALHPFFGTLSGSIESWNDKIAERIVALDGVAPVENIPISQTESFNDKSMVEFVSEGVNEYLDSLKNACDSIDDEYTKQLLMDAVLEWEKWSWQLRASLT